MRGARRETPARSASSSRGRSRSAEADLRPPSPNGLIAEQGSLLRRDGRLLVIPDPVIERKRRKERKAARPSRYARGLCRSLMTERRLIASRRRHAMCSRKLQKEDAFWSRHAYPDQFRKRPQRPRPEPEMAPLADLSRSTARSRSRTTGTTVGAHTTSSALGHHSTQESRGPSCRQPGGGLLASRTCSTDCADFLNREFRSLELLSKLTSTLRRARRPVFIVHARCSVVLADNR